MDDKYAFHMGLNSKPFLVSCSSYLYSCKSNRTEIISRLSAAQHTMSENNAISAFDLVAILREVRTVRLDCAYFTPPLAVAAYSTLPTVLLYWQCLSRAAEPQLYCNTGEYRHFCHIFQRSLGLGIVWGFFDTGAKSILLKRYRCLNGAWTDTYKKIVLIIGLAISTKHMGLVSQTHRQGLD